MVSKDKLFLVLALVIFVLVAYVIYQYGNAIATNGEEEGELSPYGIISLYYEKEVPEEYTYKYEQNTDGIKNTITLISSKDSKSVFLDAPFYTEKVYYLSDDTVLCMELKNEVEGNTGVCASLKNTTDFDNHLNLMVNLFPSKELFTNEKERMDLLIEKGAWTFNEEAFVEKEVGDSNCNNVVYNINFTKLNVNELQQLGYSPQSIIAYGNFHREFCIDEQGELLLDNFTYTYFAEPKFTTKILVEKKEQAEEVAVPTDFKDTDALKDIVSEINSLQEGVYACLISEDPDSCFKTEGVVSLNSYYCDMAGEKRDACMIMVASQKNDVSLCEKIDGAETKDDCYYDFAIKNSDPLLCDSIINLTKKDFCLGQLITTVDQ